jgi:hypothetical protein
METPFLTEETSNEPSILAQADEVIELRNLDNGDYTIEKKEETRYKEEPLSNGQVRTKRRSSFSNSEYPESGTKNTPVPPRKPSYMAPTESLKAKLRGPPRLDFDLPVDKNGFTRRQSLPSAPNSKFCSHLNFHEKENTRLSLQLLHTQRSVQNGVSNALTTDKYFSQIR